MTKSEQYKVTKRTGGVFSLHRAENTPLFIFCDGRILGTYFVYIHTTQQRKRSGDRTTE